MLYEFKVSFVLAMARVFYIEKSASIGFLYLLLAIYKITSAQECDPRNCKGPIMYYKDINCKPIYNESDNCCAIRYDCSHIDERAPNKCYVNENEYNIGEKIRDEDRSSPCDLDCTCTYTKTGFATFMCAHVDCSLAEIEDGCYFKPTANTCCEGETICPNSTEIPFTCTVNGQVYSDGQEFYPKNNPNLVCTCSEGFTEENVEQFCKNIKCGTELHHPAELHENCVPVFYETQTVQTSCPINYRCQNDNDDVRTLMPIESRQANSDLNDMMCKFGNLTMQIGDELNEATDYSSVCVKCVCDVPPTPTCQRLPDDVCDVSKHPQF